MEGTLIKFILSDEPVEAILEAFEERHDQFPETTYQGLLMFYIALTGYDYQLTLQEAVNSDQYADLMRNVAKSRNFSIRYVLFHDANTHLLTRTEAFIPFAIRLLDIPLLEQLNLFLLAMIRFEDNDFKVVGAFLRIISLHGVANKLLLIDTNLRELETKAETGTGPAELAEAVQKFQVAQRLIGNIFDQMAAHFDVGLAFEDSANVVTRLFCVLMQEFPSVVVNHDLFGNYLLIFTYKNLECTLMAFASLEKLFLMDNEEFREELMLFLTEETKYLLWKMTNDEHRTVVLEAFKMIIKVQGALLDNKMLFNTVETENLFSLLFDKNSEMREMAAGLILATAKSTKRKTALEVLLSLVIKFDATIDQIKQAIRLLWSCPSFFDWILYVNQLKASVSQISTSMTLLVLDLVLKRLKVLVEVNSDPEEVEVSLQALRDFIQNYPNCLKYFRTEKRRPEVYKLLLNVIRNFEVDFLIDKLDATRTLRLLLKELTEAYIRTGNFLLADKIVRIFHHLGMESKLEAALRDAVATFLNEDTDTSETSGMERAPNDEDRTAAALELAAVLSNTFEPILSVSKMRRILVGVERRLENEEFASENENVKLIFFVLGAAAGFHLWKLLVKSFDGGQMRECYEAMSKVARYLIGFLNDIKRGSFAFEPEIAFTIFNSLCLIAETFRFKILIRTDVGLPSDTFTENLIEMAKFLESVIRKPNASAFIDRWIALNQSPDAIPDLSVSFFVLRQLTRSPTHEQQTLALLETLMIASNRKSGSTKLFFSILAHVLMVLQRHASKKEVINSFNRFLKFVRTSKEVPKEKKATLLGQFLIELACVLMEEEGNQNRRWELLGNVNDVVKGSNLQKGACVEMITILRSQERNFSRDEIKFIEKFIQMLKREDSARKSGRRSNVRVQDSSD